MSEMYEHAPEDTQDEAAKALQRSLDRRDNGGSTG